MTVRRAWLVVSWAMAVLLASAGARAESSEQRRAAAEALFDEAGRLFKKGEYTAACTKLATSQHLDPAVGTLLNLGRCYEKIGKTASAWLAFVDAAAAAKASGEKERESRARKEASRLEPAVPKLVLQVSDEANVEGLTIQRDEEAVPKALWKIAAPTNPGDHTIRVSAPGKKPWSTSVRLAAGKTEALVIPVLEDQPGAKRVSPGSMKQPASPATEPGATSPAPSGLATHHIVAIVLGGAGVATLATGGVFGLLAKSDADTANKACGETSCSTRDALHANDSALEKATISTILFGAGGALLAGGVVFWFADPWAKEQAEHAKRERPPVTVVPLVARDAAALLVRGSF